MATKQKRKIKNFLLNRRFQIKYWAFNFSFAMLASIISVRIFFWWLDSIQANMVILADNYPEFFKQSLLKFVIVNGVWLVAVGLVSMLCTIVVTHSIIGPTVAIKRYIKRLQDGNYNEPFALRRSDEFQDIAQELNELGKILKEKSHQV